MFPREEKRKIIDKNHLRGNEMQISIVIPTYNRVRELEDCLGSIIFQTIAPYEIIIVDDSIDNNIKNLIDIKNDVFQKKKISLHYIKNNKERSLTIARNIGVQFAKGDIILFLDDDVILERNYIEEIIKIYKTKSEALGVQGHITNLPKIHNITASQKIFFKARLEKNICRILPSLQTIYPNILTEVISCEWMSGSNCSYKRKIFDEFQFDEQLKRYSYAEDVDLSYRVNKKYPGSLFITPTARLIHNVSQTGRLPTKGLYIMKHTYTFYLFNKIINQTLTNKMIFMWHKIGLMVDASKSLFPKPSKLKIYELYYIILAYYICIKYYKRIKSGHLDYQKFY